jgi:porin
MSDSVSRSRLPIRMIGLALAAGACTHAAAQAGDATATAPAPPVTSTLIYDGDALSNLRGGAARGSNYQGMLRWQTSVDAERAWGWANTSAYANVMATHHAGTLGVTGDAQGVSNIEAPSGVRLEEAWIQRNFLDGRWSALVGRYDLSSEFYRLNSAGLFLNSSFGIGPEFGQSGQGGPSIFPATATGARLAFKPAHDVVLRAAVLDGVPVDRDGGGARAFRGGDGLLIVAEVAWLGRAAPAGQQADRRYLIGRASGLDPYQDKLAVGAWHYTAQFDDLSAQDANGQALRRHGSSGAYLVADRMLYQQSAQDGGKVAGFVQLGAADARVNRFDGYLGIGVVATGFVPGRPTDELGLAAAMARNGRHYLLGQQGLGLATERAETTLELTYLSQVNPHLSLQPNLQYVIHPNTVSTQARALTLQLRAEVAF